MNNKKPLIGIILDWEKEGGYSTYNPWYALRTNYATCVADNGGLPVMIPYIIDQIDTYAKTLDGLIIPGGDYDIDPSEYGQENLQAELTTKNHRYLFEKSFLEAFLATKKPILGICAGQQLMAVARGGSLVQDILSEVEGAIEHEQRKQGFQQGEAYHDINIVPGTLLSKISSLTKTPNQAKVNSSHHQAVKNPGRGMIISAHASDGIIEAIELKDHAFALGVQWHPEYQSSALDTRILKEFIRASTVTLV